MPNAFTSVQQQAMFVVPMGSELPYSTTSSTATIVESSTSSSAISSSNAVNFTSWSQSRVLRTTLSSVPVFWQSELSQQYQELGEALNELIELEEGDEWKIDAPVYQVACYVAAELLTYSYPAPNIFTHGPESVVFNWTHGTNNLYLTISSDSISALISTPKRIERRLDFSAEQFLAYPRLLPAIRSAHFEKPVASVNQAASEPSQFLDW